MLGPIIGWFIVVVCVLLILRVIVQSISDARHLRQIGKWLNERAAEEKKRQ